VAQGGLLALAAGRGAHRRSWPVTAELGSSSLLLKSDTKMIFLATAGLLSWTEPQNLSDCR